MSHHTTNLIQASRLSFHRALLSNLLTADSSGVPSNADKDSDGSVAIARGVLKRIGEAATKARGAAQISGNKFEEAVADFLKATFLHLEHLRPGLWEIRDRRSRKGAEISDFEQYEHLATLVEVIEENPAIAAALGSDYLITPDVTIFRRPEPETRINQPAPIADEQVARLTPLRQINRAATRATTSGKKVERETLLLHASVSCKWTIRSDRVQNSRAEALNLIRNRKGRVPHIVAITAEPLPTRIASLARGTSDLDCVYHIALPELMQSAEEFAKKGRSEQNKELLILVQGKRLRDIADLPLDLAI